MDLIDSLRLLSSRIANTKNLIQTEVATTTRWGSRSTCRSVMRPYEMQGKRMEYLKEIVSFIAGAIAGGLAVKVHFLRKSMSQSRNKVGGDMAGRDINKR